MHKLNYKEYDNLTKEQLEEELLRLDNLIEKEKKYLKQLMEEKLEELEFLYLNDLGSGSNGNSAALIDEELGKFKQTQKEDLGINLLREERDKLKIIYLEKQGF